MGNQGGKALKWLPAHFNFERKICLLFVSVSTGSGHFVPKSGVGRGTGAFIYALSADETSPALAAPRRAITALFSCRKNALALPGGNGIFTATPTERITHYTLLCKVVCQRGNPFGNPRQQTAVCCPFREHTAVCCQQPVSQSACSSL